MPANLWLPTHSTSAQASSVRTLPELLEYNAKHNPTHLFCQQVRRYNGSLHLLSVTHGQLKDAVFRCQEWLRESVNDLELPYPAENERFAKGPPVALFMESDVGLWIHLLALIGLGVPVLLLSARLSPTAISHLLSTTGARSMVVSPRLYDTAQEGGVLVQSDDLRPTLYERNTYEFFLGDKGLPVPPERSIQVPGYHTSEIDRRVIILHSSGTTGLPKPIYQSHEYLLGFAAAHAFSSDAEAQHLNFSTLPLYHVSPRKPCYTSEKYYPEFMEIQQNLCFHIDELHEVELKVYYY
jgi:acyl-CoA synthetase (AMP-forming)/AMP-acid ligase II